MDSEWDKESCRPLKSRAVDNHEIMSSSDSVPRLDSENNTTESSSSGRSSKNSEPLLIPSFGIFAPDENFRALSSDSSSSSTSSDDLFQVIPTSLIKPREKNAYYGGKLDVHSQAFSKDFVSSDSSAKSEYGSSGLASTSTASEVTRESIVHRLPPTHSPPLQVMDRSGGYEPYRIPSSVFARTKSSTPVEWSIASNESLFSIHIGNNSFSRDHVVMWGGDGAKPTEPPKSPDPTLFSHEELPGEVEEAVVAEVDDDDDDDMNKDKNVLQEKQKSVGFVVQNDDSPIKEKAVKSTGWPISSSRHSDESGTSAQSFSFPIKKKSDECQKYTNTSWMRKMFMCGRRKSSSCYCSNCSGLSCCFCKWPNCSCNPNCSSCTFCYCWKHSRQRQRISCSQTLAEVERSDPIKIDPQKYIQPTQHQKRQAPKPARAPTFNSSRKRSSRCCGLCGSCSSCGSCSLCGSCGSCSSCGSCGSCGSCSSCGSCGSCFSCSSCFSCGSCGSCGSCFSCRSCKTSSCCSCQSCFSCPSCCSWRSCCSWWSCCSWRKCWSWLSCFSCRSCCSCRTCCSPFRACWSCLTCSSCRPCCSCCNCYSSFSCRLCPSRCCRCC